MEDSSKLPEYRNYKYHPGVLGYFTTLISLDTCCQLHELYCRGNLTKYNREWLGRVLWYIKHRSTA